MSPLTLATCLLVEWANDAVWSEEYGDELKYRECNMDNPMPFLPCRTLEDHVRVLELTRSVYLEVGKKITTNNVCDSNIPTIAQSGALNVLSQFTQITGP
jgi:hypothetical protein